MEWDEGHGREHRQRDKEADEKADVKLFRISESDKNDVITEVFRSKAVLVGSPTINRGILTAIAGFLEEVRGLKFLNKKAAAFGTYGWSGESVNMISGRLKEGGFEIVNEGLKVFWNPNDEAISQCIDFGKSFTKDIK